MASDSWQFWIDVGGTFTDCIALTPSGTYRQFKTLSSGICKGSIEQHSGTTIRDSLRLHDPQGFWEGAAFTLLSDTGEPIFETTVETFNANSSELHLRRPLPQRLQQNQYQLSLNIPAPVLAIRWLLKLRPTDVCPPVLMRFGTTRGTNALLTRTGARTALVTTAGFADVPLIGNQDRPRLFDLNIRKPEPLFEQVFEVDERIAADGSVLRPLNLQTAANALSAAGLNTAAFDSVAICLLNSYRNPAHEQQLERHLAAAGFAEVSRSSEVSPLIRFVPRCDTTVLDAYLNPVLRQYLGTIRDHLPGSEIRIMTSTGGLVEGRLFRGRDCVLSGPAGGVVGFSRTAEAEGYSRTIGFDMGGTSTDVARYDGRLDFQNETTKAGVRIMTPVLAIETVAAGGGSICRFDGVRLHVGPQSAGADPGPACYGAGGPLTVTDLNVFLGRVLPERFPFRLNVEAVQTRLSELRTQMADAGVLNDNADLHQLAEGLLQVANDNMVQAIRKVSVAQGYHPAEYALACFGGAGAQHACSVARSLGMSTVLIHPFAGILSAFGMGQADVCAIRQASILRPLDNSSLSDLVPIQSELQHQATQEVLDQGVNPDAIQPPEVSLVLRYRGTDSAITVPQPDAGSWRDAFEAEHRRLFGYCRPDRHVEIASVRVEVRTNGLTDHHSDAVEDDRRHSTINSDSQPANGDTQTCSVFTNGKHAAASVVHRSELKTGQLLTGPCIICEPTSTVFVEPQCVAQVLASGTIRITVGDHSVTATAGGSEHNDVADPVLLEVFNNQFASIAEQMGETLRRTSTSTNVRERLDFSCALFDRDGHLVVNAPHVPVHLGAMGETVRAVIADHPAMEQGDVYVSNDPYRGGSHLPDVTVITPVFIEEEIESGGKPDFYVANRAHHAEIGGIVPGSMPPMSKTLAEEGVLIRSRKLVAAGVSLENDLRTLLLSGPWPSRAVDDNLSDLAAQVAANASGASLLKRLVRDYSADLVHGYMKHVEAAATRKMMQCLQQLGERVCTFRDQLDDGSVICATISIRNEKAIVDFSGTADTHPGNLNANRAITTAAVLYSFRCLLNEDIPLNAGVLAPITIVIPEGLLNPPGNPDPTLCPAMVGGNVETSQRIVDVLLGALDLAAASQGTMNNLTFGDHSFGYYETICGGAGATATAAGAHAVHTHMTNTRLTDPEVLEQRYPVRLTKFSIRSGSGGTGRHAGGNGIERQLEFLRPLRVSMLSQRRGQNCPYGLHNGGAGSAGRNQYRPSGDASWIELPGSFTLDVQPGTELLIQTPGGGGFGANDA